MDQGKPDEPPEGKPPGDDGASTAGHEQSTANVRHCLSDLRKCSQMRINVCPDNHIHIEFRDGEDPENEDGKPYAEFVIRTMSTAYTTLAVLRQRIDQMLIGSGEDAPAIH